MTAEIERATAEDIEQLLPLLEELFSLEKDFEFNRTKARDALQMLLEDESRSCVLLARLKGHVVGMCSAQLVISTSQGTMSAWVEDVIVACEYRGSGIGTALVTELERWCRQQGVTRMQLVADNDNLPAHRFYAAAGWQETHLHVIKRHYKQ